MDTRTPRAAAVVAASAATLAMIPGCSSPSSVRSVARVDTQPDPNALTLYVSTRGNDAWSGRLPVPNASVSDGPFATLVRARDRVRELKASDTGLSRPVTVLLRGGAYRLTEAITFTAEDSGTEDCPIVYQAFPGEVPVISGGGAIGGWERDDSDQSRGRCQGKLWRTTVPTGAGGRPWRFNQLFVNGERRVRARFPSKGAFYRTDGPISQNNSRGFYFQEGDIEEWDNWRDAMAVVYHSWETSLHHFRSVDTESCTVTFREPAPWNMGRWEKRQRYYVENVFEALDEPGEWYLNRQTGVLYYYPMRGEKMDSVDVVAPAVTSTLIDIGGGLAEKQFVEHIHFRGLSFQHTNANLKRLRNPGQGEIYQPALVMASGLRQASFEACEVAHAGAHAIWLAAGCEDVRVQKCHLHSLGGGGVYIGGGWGVHEALPVQRVQVDNNFIHDGGHLFHGAHGVWIGRSSYNSVTHNEISNFDYSGISCGWSWGFQPSSANHNNLDYNHIHHLSNGEGLSDMGGIYTLGVSPGTTERYNHIHDIYSYAHVSHGSGLYPDEGSSEILMENNVVYRVRTCPLFMHYGAECDVRNNVLAFGGQGHLRRCREDKRCHYAAVGNIVYGDIRAMLVGQWKNDDWKVDRNVYWSTAGEPTFGGMDFATWQEKGNDTESIVADPLFIDPENGDFSLRPDSPALALGFKPIDLSQTGLYGGSEWVNLPARYENRPMNEIPAPVEPPFVVNFDFEADAPGAEPLDAKVIAGSKGASCTVSAAAAASGAHSLKFADAPGQQHEWSPHVYCYKTYAEGKPQLSWDMLNTEDAPASFYVEVRQWDVTPYLVGPTVSVAPDGSITASDQPVGMIPLGTWVHVTIDLDLNEGAPQTYRLTLEVPGEEPVVKDVPYKNPEFRKITWLGISSTSNADTVFYIDNWKLGTAEELAQPPARRARKRPREGVVDEPLNEQRLVGHWSFDDSGSYVAEDKSGYGNDGDVWAAWAEGNFGTAVYVEPGAPNVVIPDSPTLHLGTSDFTIELWLFPKQLGTDYTDSRRRFMGKNDYPRTWWVMDIGPDGQPWLEMVDANKVNCSGKPKGTVPENAWTHLAVVVDRTNGKMHYYLNGTLDSTHAIPETFTGSLDVADGDLSIGSSWQPFVGLLDDVRIYKRALPASEIAGSYEKEKSNRTGSAYKLVD